MSEKRPFVFTWQNAVRDDEELSSKAKLVLLVLSSYAALDGSSCFPSVPTLTRNCGFSMSSVRRGLREASEQGFVVIHRRQKGKHQLSNLYELRLPDPPPCQPVYTPLSDRYPPPVRVTGPPPVRPTPELPRARTPQLTLQHQQATRSQSRSSTNEPASWSSFGSNSSGPLPQRKPLRGQATRRAALLLPGRCTGLDKVSAQGHR